MCQASFYPYALRKVSVFTELTLGHSRYRLTNVPPQPNSPSDTVPSRAWERVFKDPTTGHKQFNPPV